MEIITITLLPTDTICSVRMSTWVARVMDEETYSCKEHDPIVPSQRIDEHRSAIETAGDEGNDQDSHWDHDGQSQWPASLRVDIIGFRPRCELGGGRKP